MKKIESIEQEIALIQPKLDIKASDWTKEEKEAIAKAYFEVTKLSVGRGRNLDLGCVSCISGAVGIINNYLFQLAEDVAEEEINWPEDVKEKDEEEKEEFKPSNSKWRKNHTSIDEAAGEMAFEFPEGVTSKGDKIEALEKHIAELNA